jgi:hypothetical protein
VIRGVPPRYASFARLYEDVTSALESFVLDGLIRGHITHWERDWFKTLIDGFTIEFRAWPDYPSGHPIRAYLDAFEERTPAQLRLAAHAFLHIAYDLPRVIAGTLRTLPPPSRMALRSLFLRPAPLFRQIMLDQMRRGTFGILFRPLGFLRPAEILGYWLLALRSVAWIHAESLADSPNTGALDLRLALGLMEAGRRARGSIERLDNSSLLQIVPSATIAAQDPRLIAAIVAGIAALGGAAATRYRNEQLARRIDRFGAWTFIESSKAIMPFGERFPPEPGVLVAR